MEITKEWVDDLINAREEYVNKCGDIAFTNFANNEIMVYSKENVKAISEVLNSPIYYFKKDVGEDVNGMDCVDYRGYTFFNWVYK